MADEGEGAGGDWLGMGFGKTLVCQHCCASKQARMLWRIVWPGIWPQDEKVGRYWGRLGTPERAKGGTKTLRLDKGNVAIGAVTSSV
jgi:hypothetical protein